MKNQKSKKTFVKKEPVKASVAKPVAHKAEVKKSCVSTLTEKGKIFVGLAAVLILIVMAWQTIPNKTSSYSPALAKKSVTVAKIGNETISLADLLIQKETIPQLKDVDLKVVYTQLLDSMINKKVILNAAKKAGIQKNPDVKRALKEAEESVLVQNYLMRQIDAKATPEALQALYQEELKNFVPQDEIHARHILVASEKEAKDIIVKLNAGADFATLANQYSLDKGPNGTNGGDLGYFTKDMMIPDFANPAFAMKVGEISKKPVKSPFGWHVIKVEDKRKAAAPSFESVAETLKATFAQKEVPEIIRAEREKANVQIFDVMNEGK